MWITLTIILAYLLGSVPTSVWLGKWFRGIDLREHGSGNAGATNAFRVLGKPLGTAVLVLDGVKGWAAVGLSHLTGVPADGAGEWYLVRAALGLVAVAGHIFPVFAGFRGGKGVATLTAVALALHAPAALCAMGVYLLVFLLKRISALGSLAAVLSYPVWMMAVFQPPVPVLWVFSGFVPVLVLATHRSNIRRLLRPAGP